MTEEQILSAYTRTIATAESIVFECLVLGRAADGSMAEQWEHCGQLPGETSRKIVEAARRLLLRRWRHFIHCDHCGDRAPIALMHAGLLCHACATGLL